MRSPTRCAAPRLRHLLIACAFAAGALAAGPVLAADAEAGIVWWANDVDIDIGDGEVDAGALGFHASLWLDSGWGLKGAMYNSDLEDVGEDDGQYLSVDAAYKLLSVSENNYLALGAGWEDIDLGTGISTSGPRVGVAGRVGIVGLVYGYAEAAWFPELDDSGGLSDLSGNELELGIGMDVFPFVRVRAGYRRFDLDFDSTDTDGGGSATASGLLVGGALHW